MTPEYASRFTEELRLLRSFIDFLNKQIGVYVDCQSSFSGNTVRVERQVARVLRASGRKIGDGHSVVVSTSVEDPSSPDIIIHRLIRSDEYLAANAEAGYNHQQVCWSAIVFVYAYWDEFIRPKVASIRGVEAKTILIDEFGDLRTLRRYIVHAKGHLPASEHAKLKVMGELCKPDKQIALTHDQMHRLIIHLKQGVMRLILEHTGRLPGAPNLADIRGVAVEFPRDR